MAADGMFFHIKENDRVRIRPGDLIKLVSDSREIKLDELDDGRGVLGHNMILTKGMSGVVVSCSRSSHKEPRRLYVDFPGCGLQTVHELEVDIDVVIASPAVADH